MELYDNFYHQYEDAIKSPKDVKGIRIASRDGSSQLPTLLTFPHLNAIDLQARAINWSPEDISVLQQCKNLSSIRLSPDRTNREPIPVELAELTQLETLSIKELYERRIPGAIFELPNLKEVELINVNRTTLPGILQDMAKATGLESLSLSLQFERGNEEFPAGMLAGIQHLHSLKHLALKGFPEWPAEIQQLRHLESLALESVTREGAPTPDWIWKLTQLRSLKLTHTLLSEIPPALADFKSLETLLIRLNPITEVPDLICDLSQLKHLIISNTHISHLPENIGNLQALETLEVHSSALASLPVSIGKLKNLHPVFNLSATRLTAFPKELCALSHLTSLDFSNHAITELPEEIAQLTNLQTLNLRKCKIKEFPKVLFHMKALDEVTLLQNPITRGASGKVLKKKMNKVFFGPKNRELSPEQKEGLLSEMIS